MTQKCIPSIISRSLQYIEMLEVLVIIIHSISSFGEFKYNVIAFKHTSIL